MFAEPGTRQRTRRGERAARGLSSHRWAMVGLGAVAVLVAGAGIGWLVRGVGPTPEVAAVPAPATIILPAAAATAATSSVPASTAAAPVRSTSPPPPVTTTSLSAEQVALGQLAELRAVSLPRLPTDGRWVAQVASKTVGITDPLQVAQNGSHTFYAVDILAESNGIRTIVANPSEVLVVQSTDFGQRKVAADGQAYWVTLVDANFSGQADVAAWCASTFATLDQEQRDNACWPRTLS